MYSLLFKMARRRPSLEWSGVLLLVLLLLPYIHDNIYYIDVACYEDNNNRVLLLSSYITGVVT